MRCSKCQANNPDDAEFCSLCFERFKPKAASKAPTVFIPNVTSEFGYWETNGPLQEKLKG
jgi:predicted amidophosphoribosyltransferase